MWRDISSFRQGDTKRIPKAFEIKFHGRYRVVLVWNHMNYPGEWVCRLQGIFDDRRLGLKEYDVDKAKQTALEIVTESLSNALEEVKAEQNLSG